MIYVTVTYVINFLLGEDMVHQICWPLATQIYVNRNLRTHNSTVQPRLAPWHSKETNIASEIGFSPGANRRGKSLSICVAVHEYPHDLYQYIYLPTPGVPSVSPQQGTWKNATIQHPEINLTKILDEHQTSVHDPTLGTHRTLLSSQKSACCNCSKFRRCSNRIWNCSNYTHLQKVTKCITSNVNLPKGYRSTSINHDFRNSGNMNIIKHRNPQWILFECIVFPFHHAGPCMFLNKTNVSWW